MSHYLLAGSYAYDTVLSHKGHFHHRILPNSLEKLNVSFGIDNVKDEFGGTAGNIAYNAALLGQNPMLVGCLGSDGEKYKARLESLKYDVTTLTHIAHELCAHAWLIGDNDNNQIIGFSSGAMKYKPKLPVITPQLWLLSADNPLTTKWLANEAIKQGKTFCFDPGQALPAFFDETIIKKEDFISLLKASHGIFVNEYESELLENYLSISLNKIVKDTQFIVKTMGGKGVELIQKESVEYFPVATAKTIVDPTGCGDALRAGFMSAYTQGESLINATRLGMVMGSFAIEKVGAQNHTPSFTEICARLNEMTPVKKMKP